jgi:hypothetical protein
MTALGRKRSFTRCALETIKPAPSRTSGTFGPNMSIIAPTLVARSNSPDHRHWFFLVPWQQLARHENRREPSDHHAEKDDGQ